MVSPTPWRMKTLLRLAGLRNARLGVFTRPVTAQAMAGLHVLDGGIARACHADRANRGRQGLHDAPS